MAYFAVALTFVVCLEGVMSDAPGPHNGQNLLKESSPKKLTFVPLMPSQTR